MVKKIRTRKKAQPVKCWPCKHEDLSSVHRTMTKCWVWWHMFVILMLRGMETIRSLELSSWLVSLDESVSSIKVRDAVF